jgi:nitrogen fixation protein
MLEAYITQLILRVARKYLINVGTDKFHLLGGAITLRDVELNIKQLQQEADLPFTYACPL